ncbi:MAG: FtsK/SpoIIIE domain-containing protein, partial [Candidatus Promineifilaceae bacterium]
MAEKIYIDRPPRIQPELPEGEFAIPAPPTQTYREQPLLQLILPAIAVVGYIIFLMFSSGSGTGRSPLLVIPMLIIAVASTAVSFMVNRRSKREHEAQQQLYQERLREIRRTIAQQHDLQRQFYYHNHPNPTQVLKIAQTTHRHARASANNKNSYTVQPRLWERRPNDADFGTLRLGIGARDSSVVYKLSDGASLDDPLYLEASRLLDESRIVSDVPITVSLRSPAADPHEPKRANDTRHAIGVTGRNVQWVYRFAWSAISNFATLHSPNDTRLMILGTGEAQNQWQWAAELPHSEPNNDLPICFEDSADMKLEKEASQVHRFLKELRQVLDKRRNLLAENDSDPATVRHPFLLLVVDLLSSPVVGSRLRELESDPAISTLMEEGEALGAAIMFLVSVPSKVPSGCLAQVEIYSEKADQTLDVSNQHKVTFRYTEVGVNATRYQGSADYQQHQEVLQKFATAIGSLSVRKRYGQDLPFPLHLLDLYPNVDSIDKLRSLSTKLWKRSRRASEADWLRMMLGIVAGGEKRVMKLSADADGVHGLIAGSTGSGKSELLMTMILSLAIQYDPSIVNFVLVDFKGGGAFKPLESLPHVVDVVTNLKASAVDRMFASIKAELDRRAGINTYTNMKHLIEYRKRGLHMPDENGQYGQPVTVKDRHLYTAPYPHLFIFIDEFAEMIQANPDYRAQLESITRLGRALGVTLILAAQKPTGVTDQMRANIKFRIALRVETRDDSMEVLRRPDAAHLPNGIPGRGYLQVGYDNLEMIQIAWSGADYTGRKATSKPDVVWLNRPKRATAELQNVEPPKVFEEAVRMLSNLSEEIALPQRRPWPDFLPERMSLQTALDASYLEDEFNIVETEADAEQPIVSLNRAVGAWMSGEQTEWPVLNWGEHAMRAVIGLIDNPQRSEQRPLYVDFRRGHAVVFGASGWGKTTFLRTILTTLVTTHSPDDLQVYVLDFGSRQFGVFRQLKHIGAVITPDESERTLRLLRKLDDMLDQRRRLLGQSDYSDLYAYNAAVETESVPAVLVIIDNFAEFRENFDDLMPSLVSLVRESRAYGIHFAISAELPNTVSGKLYSVLTERYALNLAVASEYTNIVGRGVTALDEIPGRGLLRQERHVLEFQVALPIGSDSDLQDERENEKLKIIISKLMARVESATSDRAQGFLHFERAISLETEVQ